MATVSVHVNGCTCFARTTLTVTNAEIQKTLHSAWHLLPSKGFTGAPSRSFPVDKFLDMPGLHVPDSQNPFTKTPGFRLTALLGLIQAHLHLCKNIQASKEALNAPCDHARRA